MHVATVVAHGGVVCIAVFNPDIKLTQVARSGCRTFRGWEIRQQGSCRCVHQIEVASAITCAVVDAGRDGNHPGAIFFLGDHGGAEGVPHVGGCELPQKLGGFRIGDVQGVIAFAALVGPANEDGFPGSTDLDVGNSRGSVHEVTMLVGVVSFSQFTEVGQYGTGDECPEFCASIIAAS